MPLLVALGGGGGVTEGGAAGCGEPNATVLSLPLPESSKLAPVSLLRASEPPASTLDGEGGVGHQDSPPPPPLQEENRPLGSLVHPHPAWEGPVVRNVREKGRRGAKVDGVLKAIMSLNLVFFVFQKSILNIKNCFFVVVVVVNTHTHTVTLNLPF